LVPGELAVISAAVWLRAVADFAACKCILADVTEAERTASGEYAAPIGELPVAAFRGVSKPARQ